MRRFRATLFFRLSFKDERLRNREKNVAHLLYIAYRTGTALPDDSPVDPLEAAGGGNKPDAHGLFSSLSTGAVQPRIISKQILMHDGIVWRILLSLREEDAQRLGLITRTQWEDAMRQIVPELAGHLRIAEPELKWVAAYHRERGHPHVHVIFWENPARRKRGLLTRHEFRLVGKSLRMAIYGPEMARLQAERAAVRDLIGEEAKDASGAVLSELRAVEREVRRELQAIGDVFPSLPPNRRKEQSRDLADKLAALAGQLASDGMQGYAQLRPATRALLDRQTREVLAYPQFRSVYERFAAAVADETAASPTAGDPERTAEPGKALNDFCRRVSGVLLRGAADTRVETVVGRAPAERTIHRVWCAAWTALDLALKQAEARAMQHAAQRTAKRKDRGQSR